VSDHYIAVELMMTFVFGLAGGEVTEIRRDSISGFHCHHHGTLQAEKAMSKWMM